MASLIPLLISAATGTTLAISFMEWKSLSFPGERSPFPSCIFHFMQFWEFTGLVSIYFTKANLSIESSSNGFPAVVRLMAGGLITSVLVFTSFPFSVKVITPGARPNGKGMTLRRQQILPGWANYFLLLLFLDVI